MRDEIQVDMSDLGCTWVVEILSPEAGEITAAWDEKKNSSVEILEFKLYWVKVLSALVPRTRYLTHWLKARTWHGTDKRI